MVLKHGSLVLRRPPPISIRIIGLYILFFCRSGRVLLYANLELLHLRLPHFGRFHLYFYDNWCRAHHFLFKSVLIPAVLGTGRTTQSDCSVFASDLPEPSSLCPPILYCVYRSCPEWPNPALPILLFVVWKVWQYLCEGPLPFLWK